MIVLLVREAPSPAGTKGGDTLVPECRAGDGEMGREPDEEGALVLRGGALPREPARGRCSPAHSAGPRVAVNPASRAGSRGFSQAWGSLPVGLFLSNCQDWPWAAEIPAPGLRSALRECRFLDSLGIKPRFQKMGVPQSC